MGEHDANKRARMMDLFVMQMRVASGELTVEEATDLYMQMSYPEAQKETES